MRQVALFFIIITRVVVGIQRKANVFILLYVKIIMRELVGHNKFM